MKSLIVLIVVSLGVTYSLLAQETVHSEYLGSEIVAEAHYFGSGMAGIVGNRLIARVFKDGTVEFDDIEKEGKVSHKRTRISKKNLEKLNQLLLNSDTAIKLSRYKAVYTTIDHTQDLKLFLLLEGKRREIYVENFKPNLPKTQHVYPIQLVKIACLLESARKTSKVKFFFNGITACDD